MTTSSVTCLLPTLTKLNRKEKKMSSYVIDKKEYIKAAGLVRGYELAKSNSHVYLIEHVYDWFARCYQLNVASVNEQYDTDDTSDNEEYRDVFEEYTQYGIRIYSTPAREKLAYSLWKFFRSAIYQIDNEQMEREVQSIFYICLTRLFNKKTDFLSAPWWGEIDIENIINKEVLR